LIAIQHSVSSSAETIGAFNIGFDTANLHHPTMDLLSASAAAAEAAAAAAAAAAASVAACAQGLTLVHFPSQLEPCLTQNTP